MSRKTIIILGIFLGLVALLLTAAPLISPTIQTKLWKTQLNSKIGYQVLIPATWQVEEWNIEDAASLKPENVAEGTILYQGKFFGQSGHFEILVWKNKNQVPVRTWLTWFRHEDLNLADLPKEENYLVAQVPAIRYLQKKTAKGKPILYVFFAKDEKIYELTSQREDLINVEATESSEFTHQVYDKILESFQLGKSAPTAPQEYQ